MSLQQSPTITAEHACAPNGSETRLQGAWLVLARVVWVAITLLTLALYVVSIPSYFAYLHILSPVYVSDQGAQLSLKDLQTLQAVGLSIDFYAWYNIIFNILFVLSFVLVGLVIFWRKSDDHMALLASFTLLMFPIDNEIIMLQTLPPAWGLFVNLVNFLGSISLYLFFYLFPSGHFDRRWIGWLTAGMVLFWIANVFFPVSPSASFLNSLYFAFFLAFSIAIFVIQIYRYRHLSTPIERQQTKWVVFGSAVGLTGYLVGIVVVFLLLNQVLHVGMLPFMLGYTVVDIFLCCIPLSIAIAILRSRLWDIDIIINRALVYGTLTMSLALVYSGLVVASQALLGGLISQTNDVAIVASTLVIAALFQPLRSRIQRVIDRRFYRRKYNAARTLTAFSTTLRNEVDLSQLSEQLAAVVQETMQPTHISLWLRPPAHHGTQRFPWRANPPVLSRDEEREER
jgi:hypothetical protein